MQIQKIKGFTLVELIVVVTILAVLATIWFVSYSSYLTWVRDTNRISQLVSISDWLELYSTRNDLPLPDDNVEVQINGDQIAYQGKVWANVLETIDFTKWWVDPRDNEYFSYYLTSDRRYFQLMAFLEEDAANLTSGLMTQTLAVDYTDRVPTVAWRKLWILVDDTSNEPVEDTNTTVNITTANASSLWFKSIIGQDVSIEWTDLLYLDSLRSSWWVASSCKTLLERKNSLFWNDGIYLISPEKWSAFPIYCDMTTDGWWWTLTFKAKNGDGTSQAVRFDDLADSWTCLDFDDTNATKCKIHPKYDYTSLMVAAHKNQWSWNGNEYRYIINNLEKEVKDYFSNWGLAGNFYQMTNPTTDFQSIVDDYEVYDSWVANRIYMTSWFYIGTSSWCGWVMLMNTHSNTWCDKVTAWWDTTTDTSSIVWLFLR